MAGPLYVYRIFDLLYYNKDIKSDNYIFTMNTRYIWTLIILIVIIAVVWLAISSRTSKVANEVHDDSIVMEDDTMVGATVELTDGTYAFNPEESTIEWTGTKTLVLDYEDRGVVALADGSLTVNGGIPLEGEFVVDMTSISTDLTGNGNPNENLDAHLKSPDFFDVETYPTATFELTGVVSTETPGTYTVTGDLTIKGITNTVTFPAQILAHDDVLTVLANIEIDRSKWDVRFGSSSFFDDLGDRVIDDMIGFSIVLRGESAE